MVAANGGDDNAFTTPDYTAYHQRIAADRLDLVMGMEADRMVEPRPRRGVRCCPSATWCSRSAGSGWGTRPDGPFGEQLRAALYLNHPYRHPVIGWEHEMAGLDREAAMAFYRAHYAPNNAILVVAGDVDPAEVRAAGRGALRADPGRRRLPPRVRPQEPPPVAARRIEMQRRAGARALRRPRLYLGAAAQARRPGARRRR